MTSFSMALSNIKYLGVIITKQVKDLYDKIFKTLKKESKEGIRRGKELPCSWMVSNSIVKMVIIPKAIYRLNSFS